jgi:excinuclease ABC subunit C
MMDDRVHPLQSVVATLPTAPGVYRFINPQGEILYIGKARVLRQRVGSYFARGPQELSPRILAMLSQATQLELTVTPSETDALLLEASMIQQHKPRYNVLLKDGKSYPYLHLSTDTPFPTLTVHRGDRTGGGQFYGPYPSVRAVRDTLHTMQKLFPLRQCSDQSANWTPGQRQRPCLQQQIGRCHAPCCHRISAEDYRKIVEEVTLFLEGKDRQLIASMEQAMWQAAERLEYEQAATLRNRIRAITHVQERRRINLSSPDADLDIVAIALRAGVAAVQVFFVRAGINLGNRLFFPALPPETGLAPEEVLQGFLEQFYIDKPPPAEILVSHDPDPRQESGILQRFLRQQRGRAVTLRRPLRGEKQQLMQMAIHNAELALERRLTSRENWQDRLVRLADRFNLPALPTRIEVYDISHSQGELPVGVMVVCGPDGFQSSAYRKFAIRDTSLPDDTSRMAEVLTRRFRDPSIWPDLVLLDGGVGQLNAVLHALAGTDIPQRVHFAAIAKGVDHRDHIFLPDQPEPLWLEERDPLLFFLQTIRDEAHRCAIGYHRKKRDQHRMRSELDQIAGIGPQRKKALLHHFGSVRSIRGSSVEELVASGILSRPLAERVYHFLRDLREDA